MLPDEQRIKVGQSLGLVAAVLVFGCATLRPLPAGKVALAQVELGGIVVSVPRLEYANYPGDVLERVSAVMVVIENRSGSEILVEPERFFLSPAGSCPLSPITPEELAQTNLARARPKCGAEPAPKFPTERLLAAIGSGVYVTLPMPRLAAGAWTPPRASRFDEAPVRLRVPGWNGGYYTPHNYQYAHSRWAAWIGGPLYWGRAWWIGWYGNPWFWPWFYEGPRAHDWSREDAAVLALPAGRLPSGGRTGGFLFFPRLGRSQGLPLVLQWAAREAKNQRVLGTVHLALELRAD